MSKKRPQFDRWRIDRAKSCADCPYSKGERDDRGNRMCAVFDVIWECCEVNPYHKVCEREGLL